MAGMRFSLNSARAVIAPTRSGSERGTIPVKKESIGEISIAPAFGPGFRAFSLRGERKKRSRRSLSTASRRGGRTDCARSRRAVLTGGQGSSRGGGFGAPLVLVRSARRGEDQALALRLSSDTRN